MNIDRRLARILTVKNMGFSGYMSRIGGWIIVSALMTLVGCSGDGNSQYTGLAEGVTLKPSTITGGKIDRIYVNEGDRVEKDDILAVMDTTELALQITQLEAALDEIAINRRALQAATGGTKATLKFAQKNYDRSNTLFDTEALPAQSLDEAKMRLDNASSAAKSGDLQVASLDAKERQVLSNIEIVRKRLRDAVVKAGRGGVVSDIYFEETEAAAPLSPLMEIVDADTMTVDIYVEETMLPVISVGQKAVVHLDGSAEKLDAKVTRISQKAEFTPKSVLTKDTRTSLVYRVTVRAANPDGIIKHGMPVVVELDLPTTK